VDSKYRDQAIGTGFGTAIRRFGGDISIALFGVVPVLMFLRSLRERVLWIQEAEGVKDMVRRVLRATLVTLLHLVALYFYYRLLWCIFSQHPGGFR
jgi:hypothetical protein